MRKIFMIAVMLLAMETTAQTYENQFRRPVSDVMRDLAKRFDVRFKFDGNVDTAGVVLPYADFRIRPYSLEQTLDNICKHFDWNWWKQSGNVYKIKRYEYPRRHEEEGRQMLDYLSTLYSNKAEWEARRDSLRREVRQRLELDAFLDSCVLGKPLLSKIRKHDGYTTQNICIELTPGQHLFGTIYASTKKGKHALIVCPDGHWPMRYRKDEQQRLGTLARMGAVCVDFDLYGWGESEKEVGAEAHHTSRAHVYQAACGYILLDWMLKNRKDIDPERVGVMGGSGGGTHTVLLSLLDERVTASAPVVHLASHFDGGCPCESGKPVQLAAGGTCEPELAAVMAPKPMLIVSDGGDWTSSVPTLEFPYLQRIYSFYGAKDKVRNVHLPNERHDFNENKRQAVYDFFIDVFGLDRTMLDESKITIEPDNDLKSLYK
jgi:dienelactone hydrolase